jgi:subtilisin family serine protease
VIAWLRGLLLLAALLLAAPAAARDPANAAPDREILVMVHHPPEHFRPGSAYGGGYGDELARSARERLARRIARSYNLALVDSWPMPMIGMDCFVMAIGDGRSTVTAAAQVARDSDVAWAQPVGLYQAQSAPRSPNDPLYPAQPAARQWQLADLHRIATGRGTRVAVIDSGIEARHPDLAGQLLLNRNFVAGQSIKAEEHGTGVAGIIAAKEDNGIGIAGIAPGARLLGLRACWETGSAATPTVCDSFSLAKALYFAIGERPDVINLSISGPDDRLLAELVKVAVDRGSTVVAAVNPNRADGGFPASAPGVIAVSDRALAASRKPVYIAPGRDVPTTQTGGRWFLVNGSSFASAHVSGLAALVRERRPAAMLNLVSQLPGGGTIDACATLQRAVSGCDCSCSGSRLAGTRTLR